MPTIPPIGKTLPSVYSTVVAVLAALTTSYVTATVVIGADTATGVFGNDGALSYDQLVLYVQTLLGASTENRIQLRWSPDGDNWFDYSAASTDGSTGVTSVYTQPFKFGTTGTFVIPVQIRAPFIAVLQKATTSATGAQQSVRAQLSRSPTKTI